MKLKTLIAALLPVFGLVRPFPKGAVASPGAAPFDLPAFFSNANAISPTRADITTAGTAVAVSAANLVKGEIILAAGASGGFTLDLATAAAIIAALGGPNVQVDGTFSKVIHIKNNAVGQTGTVTVASGDSANTTLTGTMTIATNTTRTFLLTVTSAGKVSLENLGSMSL